MNFVPKLSIFITALSIAVCGVAAPNADLSGTYDSGTVTPLERPEAFGDKQFMSAEEAQSTLAALEEKRRLANQESDPDRGAPVVGGDGNLNSGAGGVGGYNQFWVDPGSVLSEVDGKVRTSIIYEPTNGRRPKFTFDALMKLADTYRSYRTPNDGTANWLAKRGPGPYDGPESLAPPERCLMSFTPSVPNIPGLYNNYRRIVQTDSHVMILNEMVHDARIIRIDSAHAPGALKSRLGDSVGHWEGNTLVVNTKNFSSVNSLPGADENLEVTEYLTRLDDGNLHYRFTIVDPSAWKEQWSGEYIWQSKNEDKVYEYACHEGNYAMKGILQGARLLEKETLAKEKTETPNAS